MAVLNKQNTCTLCDRLGTSILKLPETFAGRFKDNDPSYVPSQINAIFSEMLDFLLSEGCATPFVSGSYAHACRSAETHCKARRDYFLTP